MAVLEQLQQLLAGSLARHGLPGAVVSVSLGGRRYEAAAGVINTLTGVPATVDSRFMYGSVTKVATATALLRLLEEGRVRLDDPVSAFVEGFTPQQEEAREITVEQLLTHSSGLVGSVFKDTGSNDDAIAAQVAFLNELPLYHRPGELLSYCNMGYVLLGRLIELQYSKPWHRAIQEEFVPAFGLHSIVTRPQEALRHSTAVGHVLTPDAANWTPVPEPFALPGHGPAGSSMAGTASDLVSLAESYLNATGLSEATSRSAWAVQMPALVPAGLLGWGHGWMVFDWAGQKVVGHDGSTAGTKAFLRVMPDAKLCVALLVNAQVGLPVYEDVVGAIFRECVGIWETTAEDLSPVQVDEIAGMAGAYQDSHLRLELEVEGGESSVSVLPVTGNPIHRSAIMKYPITPCGRNEFYTSGAGLLFYPPAGFLTTSLARKTFLSRGPDGEEYLSSGANVYRRLDHG